MSTRERSRPGGSSAVEPVSPWAVGAIVVAVLAVLAASAVVISAVSDRNRPSGVPVAEPPTTVTEGSSPSLPDGEADEEIIPTGRIAYVGRDGSVSIGSGAAAPVQIAHDAAIGAAGLGAVEVAPTSDVVAYVRNDGALISLPAGGGEPTVLATDVALEAVGVAGPVLSWDATGSHVAYIAVGTEDMVEPRPETPPPLSMEGVYRVPLPEGVLGNVLKVVDRTGVELVRVGDPSTRSMVSVTSSQSDDLMIVESVSPDTNRPYTLLLASSGSAEEIPTVLSADDPAFSPDGNFVIAVGPDKSGQELLRVDTDALSRSTLVSTDRICNPVVSPDSTRIVYGTGPNCEHLHLISSRGGRAVDITPPARPGDATFSSGALGWTAEGRFITFADCRSTDGPVRCGGAVTFLDPDQRVLVDGPVASTVAPVRQPLLQALRMDLVLSGPLEYEGSFPVDAETEGEATELGGTTGKVDLTLSDGDRSVKIELQVQEGVNFATGRMTIADPAQGIDRSFLILGTPSVIGIRVVSLSGIWVSTDDLPVATGEFRLALRRG